MTTTSREILISTHDSEQKAEAAAAKLRSALSAPCFTYAVTVIRLRMLWAINVDGENDTDAVVLANCLGALMQHVGEII